MSKTNLSIAGERFLINGKPVYAEIAGSYPNTHGLLMNARFIQGIFDDKVDPGRFNRFGRIFHPDQNTNDLIAALPEWYTYGLRAFTVGFQGGGPCFTTDNRTIENNPFGEDGKTLDQAYADRMDRLIRAADALGMVVIISFFYGAQARRLKDGRAVLDAVKTASRFLKENGYTNCIIEVANEHNIGVFDAHPIIQSAEGMVALMELARQESGGLPVGCSGGGGYVDREICEASDVILIHGNGCSRQVYYNMIQKAKKWGPGKPVVCNEDSQAIGQMVVAYQTNTSWGYYNNLTKQEPPADWRVTPGEDRFFAYRMAEGIGIKLPQLPPEDCYYLQGLEAEASYEGKRWLRVASRYPETINFVEFYYNNRLAYVSYDEPFSLYWECNWYQNPRTGPEEGEWMALIHLRNGEIVRKTEAEVRSENK